MFAVGLACVAAVPWRPLPAVARTAGLVGLGIGAGFLLTGGAWAAYLWISLGNPVFPALNTIFRSPSAAFSDYADLRFLPAGFWDGLAYPAKIAFGLHPTAEVPFREPRFLVVLGVLAALAVSTCLPRGRGSATLAGPRHRLLQASVFLLVSMAAWLRVFAIQRYAVSLEILSGVVAVMALSRVMHGGPALAAAVALAGGIVGATQPPDWWRRPWADAVTIAPPPELSVPAAYAVVAHPVGYWASALPGKSRFYTVDVSLGLATGGVLQDRVRRGLQHPPNSLVRTLGHDFPMSEAARDGLAAQGLAPAGPCVRARSLWWVDTISCVAARAGIRPRAAADLAVGEAVDFSAKGSGWIYLAGAWRSTVAAGTEAQAGRSELVLHVGNTDHSLVLDLTLQGAAPDQPRRRLGIVLDGVEQAPRPLPLPGQSETASIGLAPVGAAPATRSVVLDTEGRADLPSFVLQRMLLREAGQRECRP